MTQPIRVQLQRRPGWRIPPNTVIVDRRTKFGNPCRVGLFRGYTAADAVRDFEKYVTDDLTVRSFQNAYGKPPSIETIRAELAGKNLACWCPLDQPCHADMLLKIANGA